MKYFRTTMFSMGPPIDLEDTEVVYMQAVDAGELLPDTLDAHGKPVKDYEEITKSVYDANV